MARRKTGLLDEIATLPWYIGVALGIIAFVFVRQFGGLLAPLAWMFLAGCWLAALVSFVGSQKRKQLLETQTGLDTLAKMSWREFEMLVGEAFRRRGYFVEETGLGGKDGGIDLVVSKGGRKELVQCKQWRTRQVRASTVREMWGLAHHHGAAAVHIVCIGDFTPDAAAFARGKSIELIDGQVLLEMVRGVQRNRDASASPGPAPTAASLECRPQQALPLRRAPDAAVTWSKGKTAALIGSSGTVLLIRNVAGLAPPKTLGQVENAAPPTRLHDPAKRQC